MLAQNFKSASDLGLTDAEHRALVTVLGMLERGEIKAEQFDMGNWCGTACCIGGWAENIGAVDFSYVDSEALDRLFWPPARGAGPSGFDATPTQGARALRNYLTTGEPRWSEVMESA